jgi:hypothetical protein
MVLGRNICQPHFSRETHPLQCTVTYKNERDRLNVPCISRNQNSSDAHTKRADNTARFEFSLDFRASNETTISYIFIMHESIRRLIKLTYH